MADDAARIAQLEAELRHLREIYQAARSEAMAATAERDAALEQQTATSEILRMIASSLTDVQPVLNAVVESAVRLSRSVGVRVAIIEGSRARNGTIHDIRFGT
jgi:hypothetical protein